MKHILLAGLVSLGLAHPAAAGFLEEFETETALSTTFSEPGGPTFTVDGDLMVETYSSIRNTSSRSL